MIQLVLALLNHSLHLLRAILFVGHILLVRAEVGHVDFTVISCGGLIALCSCGIRAGLVLCSVLEHAHGTLGLKVDALLLGERGDWRV